MPSINRQLFKSTPTLDVRAVTLSADDDLQTHREKLARIVLDEMVHFVGLLDAKGITLEINRAALEGAGICLDDIQGKPFWDARWWAVSKDTRDNQRDLVRRAAQGEFVRCDVEIYGQAAGEQTIIVDYSLRPIKDQSGKVVFLLPEGHNITEKKRAEAEIARKNEELQRLLDKIRYLDDVKNDFFANVSHELRTPLALILGPAESILASGDNLTEPQRRDLVVIHRNAAILAKHVNDLLDLAKLDAGKMTLNYARIDLAREVRQVAAHFDALAPPRSLTYTVAASEILEADVDPEKFDSVLINLLSNAFKFTPAGGRIRCALEHTANDRLLLSVQDSGPGIAAEMRAVIFDRFRQVQGGTARDFGGTGLGLAIAKDFVQLHGGNISISEAPGGGSLFQVEMPLFAPPGTYVRHFDLAAAALPGSGVNGVIEELQCDQSDTRTPAAAADCPLLLVVEDNGEMCRFITEVLENEYRVIAAADGIEALEKATAQPPDLVVTDLMMPKMGGDRLVAEMRARPALAHVPVLVLSARADESLRLRLLAESVQDYITKPFSANELRVRVRNLVTMKRARDALQQALATQNQDLWQLTRQLISSRQQLQNSLQALQESEQRWRAVYENSAVGIALSDLDGNILAVNPACQTMLGYAEEELRKVSVMQITCEQDSAASRSYVEQLRLGSIREYHLQKRYERKDGGVVWASTNVSLIPGSDSMAPMLVGIIEDITERKNAEEALLQAQSDLARVSRVTTMGELVASIAHEINQPLAAVVANGQASLRWLAVAPSNVQEAEDAVRRIVRDANRASEVIARIRQFLKRGDSSRAPVAVAEVIADALVLVQDQARSNGISLSSAAAADLPAVLADRVQLQQVLLNLVMNAIEAMASHDAAAHTLAIDAARQNGTVVVAVRDSGVGLDPAQREHIFDAFYTTKADGMGMGLAISRSIIEAHGGRLWATANSGEGETFRFSLPAYELSDL